jgi:hypothetical protein
LPKILSGLRLLRLRFCSVLGGVGESIFCLQWDREGKVCLRDR